MVAEFLHFSICPCCGTGIEDSDWVDIPMDEAHFSCNCGAEWDQDSDGKVKHVEHAEPDYDDFVSGS